MATLLFKLAHVPDDEAEAVRQLLEDNEIDYYETSVGRWMLGVAAIWLPSTAQLEQARSLIAEYQQQRYQDAQYDPVQQNWWSVIREKPLQLFMTLLSVVIVLGVTLIPFLNL